MAGTLAAFVGLVKTESKEESKTRKIATYNCNGLAGILKKNMDGTKSTKQVKNNCLEVFISKHRPDILCLQEIRCSEKFVWTPPLSSGLVHVYALHSTDRKGYSGVLIASKVKPISVTYELRDQEGKEAKEIEEREGRIITLEFPDYFLVNVYVPNSGRTFKRLEYRTKVWEPAFRRHINYFQSTKGKPVIVVGDLNVMPEEIDTAFPASRKLAGSSPEEKQCFRRLLDECKLIDTFRALKPTERKYSWFSGAITEHKVPDMGCRLDFCLISAALREKLLSSEIVHHPGSDHTPMVAIFAI